MGMFENQNPNEARRGSGRFKIAGDSSVDIKFLKFRTNEGTPCSNQIRPFPCPTHDGTDVMPYAYQTDKGIKFSGFFSEFDLVRNVGNVPNNRVSFLANVKGGGDSPYWHLCREAKKYGATNANRPEFALLWAKPIGSRDLAPLSWPQTVMAIQGIAFQLGTQPLESPEFGVFILPRSAKDAFMTMLIEVDPKYREHIVDYEQYLQYHELPPALQRLQPSEVFNLKEDILSPASTKMLVFAPDGAEAGSKPKTSAPSFTNVGGGGGGYKKKKVGVNPDGEVSRYTCSVVDIGQAPSKAQILQFWKPWDKALYYCTAEEQVAMICEAFTPNIALSVFMNTKYEAMVPSHVKDAYRTAQVHGVGNPSNAPAAANYGQGREAYVPGMRAEAPVATAAPSAVVATTVSVGSMFSNVHSGPRTEAAPQEMPMAEVAPPPIPAGAATEPPAGSTTGDWRARVKQMAQQAVTPTATSPVAGVAVK